jgi:hypothetical protein
LTDWISLGVLTSTVPRDVVEEVVTATGKQAQRSDGKLPPHVVVYLVMALALFADEDYEEVAARLSDTLTAWGAVDPGWSVPSSGGITQARQRLGAAPLAELFDRVAVPVAEQLTVGAWLGPWRLMAVDGMEWDVPATKDNDEAFGYHGAGAGEGTGYPKVRVVTISECGSHAVVAAALGPVAGLGSGEESLARQLWGRLEPDWLVLADRNFFNWQDWCAAAGSGAALLWRVKEDLRLPVLGFAADGSYTSVVVNPRIRRGRREALIAAAREGREVDARQARWVRVVEYTVPDRGDGPAEVICLITTVLDPSDAPAAVLAQTYHQRWEHEEANRQLKSVLRGPGRVLRSKSPQMVRQEIYGYLLTHYAISVLICRAATEAAVDPDRVKFTRTVRLVRRRVSGPAAFSP